MSGSEPTNGRLWSEIEDALGMHDSNMSRLRPYDGQPHTNTGKRGATEIKGVTFRDLRDCYIRAVLLSAHHLVPHLYKEATKGEQASLCENDLRGFDLNQLSLTAICQNLCVEVEKLMGIYPNIPKRRSEKQ